MSFSSTRWYCAFITQFYYYFFFIVCVRDLCHPSSGACWGRFSGRGCRVQVEESRTQDGNWNDTPTHLLSEKEEREVSRAISNRPSDKPAAAPPKAGFLMKNDGEFIWVSQNTTLLHSPCIWLWWEFWRPLPIGGGGRWGPPIPGLSGGRGGLPPGPLRGGSRPGRPIGEGAADDLMLPPMLRPEGGGGGRGPVEVGWKKRQDCDSAHTHTQT